MAYFKDDPRQPKFYKSGDWGYWKNWLNYVEIGDYFGSQEHLQIPAVLDGEEVDGISMNAFTGSPVKTVTFPYGINSIGEYAFADCTALKKISFSETSSQSFGDYAFENCVSLEDVENQKIEALGYYTFSGCRSLKSVSFDENLEIIPENAFQDCISLTQITLPEGITSIGSEAFAGCTGLKRCNIPESVEDIDYDAFRDCPDLVLTVCPGHHAIAYARKNQIPFVLDVKVSGYDDPLYAAIWELFNNDSIRKTGNKLPPLPVDVSEERFGSWKFIDGEWVANPGFLKRLSCFRFSVNASHYLHADLSQTLSRCASMQQFSLSFREPCLCKCSASTLEKKYPQLTNKLEIGAEIVSVCEITPTFGDGTLYFALSGSTLYILENYWYD